MKPAKPTIARSSGSPSSLRSLLPEDVAAGGGAAELWTINIGIRRRNVAATSRSIATAASPQRSINEVIALLRPSAPSWASAERRCQTTRAPWRCATPAAARIGESLMCTIGKRYRRINSATRRRCARTEDSSRSRMSQRSPA
jgi:hypothetical protein